MGCTRCGWVAGLHASHETARLKTRPFSGQAPGYDGAGPQLGEPVRVRADACSSICVFVCQRIGRLPALQAVGRRHEAQCRQCTHNSCVLASCRRSRTH